MKSRTLMCVTAITVFTALAIPVRLAAQQTVSGTNGQIVFVQGDLFGNIPTAKVFIANPDGSGIPQQVPLGDPIEFATGVVWSPDGSKLLIDHTFPPNLPSNLPAIVGFDGLNYTLLTIPNAPNGLSCDVWTHDQTRILCGFGPNGDQNAGAFSVQVSDGSYVRLTTNPFSASGGSDSPADISPDGTRFVFLRFKPAAVPPPTPAPDNQVALFVENLDGTGLRQITPFLLSNGTSANWSPDGSKIISQMSNGRLLIVDPNGGGVTPIHLQVGTQKFLAFQPAWSPDGTRIIFNMFIHGGNGIYTANPDGSGVEQVMFTTNSATFFNGPNWGTHPVTP